MKRTILFLLVGLGVVGGLWFAYQRGMHLPLIHANQPDAGASAKTTANLDPGHDASGDKRRVVALGWIEPAEGVIELRALPGDRLEKLEVREGSVVKKGQPLAYLESRSLRNHELEVIASQLKEAEARRTAEKKLAEAQITAAELAVKEAEMVELDIRAQQIKNEVLRANLDLARSDVERIEGLSKDLVSTQERERQALVVQQAEAELSAAEAMLEKMEKSRSLGIEAARAKLQAAEATKDQVITAIPVESLTKRLELARTQWDQTAIKAPRDGVILKVFAQDGESVGATPILQMGSLDRMVAVAEVYETNLQHIKPGQAAVIDSRAFLPPHDQEGIRGKVARIGKIISQPELKSLDPLARADRHVAEVRIELDEESSRRAANLVNLQVDVTILIEP